MRSPIRPGKVTCAGLVGILMVLPNTMWKNPRATEQKIVKPHARVEGRAADIEDSARTRLTLRKKPR